MTQVQQKKAKILYKRLYTYVKPFWPVLLIGIVGNILYSSIDATFTYLMRPFLDKGLIEVDPKFVTIIPLIVFFGVSLRGLFSSIASYSMTWIARSVVKVLREHVFSHIIYLPARYYDEATSGELLSKLLYDVEQVAKVSADALTDFVQNTCLIIGLVTVMMIVSWQLSVMFLLVTPIIGLIVNYTNKRIRRISHKVQKNMGEVTEIAGEAIDGYRVVRIFGGQSFELNKFNRVAEDSRINDMKVAASKSINVFSVQFMIAIAIASIIFVAIKLANQLNITPGAFFAIIAAMIQLIKPMKTLTNLNAVIQRGLAGAESVFNLIDSSLESKKGKVLTSPIKGQLEFNHVSFAYQGAHHVLQNISFSVKAGEVVALVGHSGSGKSTIASLIPRFYDIDAGDILLDGHSIKSLSLQSLRSNISIVSQQVTLFNDSILNNIAYAQKNVSKDAVIKAAQMAYAHEFIEALPNGYDTIVGDNGLLLSGGQRQRLAIARAILKDAPVLILDEATSALDNESERYIQSAMDEVMKNRTTIIIAHRLSTVKKADNIMVLDKGQIKEQGTHDILIKANGIYASLYFNQQSHIDDTSIENQASILC